MKGSSVYLQESTISLLQERNIGQDLLATLANREIRRLYALYADALRSVNLSHAEALALCDVLNGTFMDETTARLLWAEVEDACRMEGLADKWGIDGPALVAKLKAMSLVQCMAIIDAATRAWLMASQGEMEMDEAVRKCFA